MGRDKGVKVGDNFDRSNVHWTNRKPLGLKLPAGTNMDGSYGTTGNLGYLGADCITSSSVISLIRAGAKNYKDVMVVSQKNQYQDLLNILEKQEAFTDLDTRKKYAVDAFNLSSDYDTHIFDYLNDESITVFKESIQKQ